jgi:heme-degrading monooxygenase HmoA
VFGLINHIVNVIVKPGRAADFCRAIQDNLSIWRAQPGFIDEIVLAEPGADRIVAQSFWTTVEDADRFNAEVFPRITAIVKDFMAAPPKSVTYQVAVSTNRNIVPDDDLARVIANRPSDQADTGNLATQAMKLPPKIMISALELLLHLSRGARDVYDGAIDGALELTRGTARNASAVSARAATMPVETDIVRDTLNALIAFVVPGSDAYSVSQGESTPEPGGCDAGILDTLIKTINATQPPTPRGPSAVSALTGALNQIALKINPSPQSPFLSPFARLSMAEKAAVFQTIEADPQIRALAGVLVPIAFLVYSEAGVFDPRKRIIRSWPLGWTLSNYEGVADGRDDFKGYYQNRQSVATDPAIAGTHTQSAGS